jgi:hypothetical protein
MQRSVAQPAFDASHDRSSLGRLAGPLRDVARGGLAGLLTGILVAGLGGRIVMRLAAIIVPTSAGRFTENGNQIGDITSSGSLALILFGGLFFGLSGGVIWVVVSPWIPGSGFRRAILAMPIAVALTGVGLVKGSNPDFQILQHHGLVVAMLLVLVALAGASIALLDGWLDDRLPRPGRSGRVDSLYAALTVAGSLLVFPVVLQAYLAASAPVGLALVAVGVATLAWWTIRLNGRDGMPTALVVAGRGALLVAVVLGVLDLGPDVAVALGI